LFHEWAQRTEVHSANDRAAAVDQPQLPRIRDELVPVGSISGQIDPACT